MEKDELLVIYGKDIRRMTEELLERSCLAERIPDPHALIGIKPNLVSEATALEGATTHPEVIESLIDYLKKHGFTNLVMLEGSWVGSRTAEVAHYCGYDRLSKASDVPFWDMHKDTSVKVDCGGMPISICKKAREVDFLINVPVLKGHCQTKITCALKNMKGLIPNSEKRRFHRMGLHAPIAHLALGIHQDFILVDSICGDLTFEDGGNPVEQNRLIASLDPVLCDTYGCSLLGIPLSKVPYIEKAAALGAGSTSLDLNKVTVLREKTEGETIQYLADSQGTIPPVQGGYRHVMRLAEKAEEVDSCSACYGYLIPALQMLEDEGLLGDLKEKVCIGQGHRGKQGELGVGSCTKNFRHTLAGCPPTEQQMYEFLKDYIKNEIH